jgi:hypothetical protein
MPAHERTDKETLDMNRSRSTCAKLTVGLLLVGTFIGVLACQDTAATSPSARLAAPSALAAHWPKPGRKPGSLSAVGRASKKLHCSHTEPQTTSAVIGPEGGTLRIGRHRLIVPAGALNEETLITGTVPADSSATVTFEPSGLKFKRPASLVLTTKDCDVPAGDPSVMYIDDTGKPVEELPSVFDRAREEVTTPIHHFSGYQVWV